MQQLPRCILPYHFLKTPMQGFDLAAMYEDLKSTEIQLKQLLADMAATAAMTTPTDQQVGVRQSAAIMLDAA